MSRDRGDHFVTSSGSGRFHALSGGSEPAPFDQSTQDDPASVFRPLSWTDQHKSQVEPSLNDQDLAARIAEVQQLAYRKGRDSGREEAVRLAQASLMPHLKSMIQAVNALIAQAELAEQQTSANAISLAMTIVEKVTGTSAGRNDFHALEAELGRAVAAANRTEIHIRGEDLNFFRELSENSGLAWPESAWIAFQANSAIRPGQVQISDPNDQREELFQHVTDQISRIFSS